MILYLDTSALVKAYVNETSSPEVMKAFKKAKIIASHMVAFVEAHAAFSRIKRENKITETEFDSLKNSFSEDWKDYFHMDTTKELIEYAADLSDAFGLRASDSMHLAAANTLLKHSKNSITFACFDKHLNKAAKLLGLELLIN